MKKIIPALIAILCLFDYGSAQQNEPCGIDRIMNTSRGQQFYQDLSETIRAHPLANSSTRTQATLTVPLVFHIVYNTPAQNIPDSLILQQIDRLNEDFRRLNADTINTPAAFAQIAGAMDIEFCLATEDPSGNPTSGILRIPTNQSSFASVSSYNLPDPIKHNSSGGSDAWDTEDYLNIWICNLTGSTAYTAPVGNFVDPADDGIVCHYNHVGNSGIYPYGEGRSIVHEMGHWFGLKHIWGDDAGVCTGTDFIADTPNQANWNGNCPSFPHTDNCSPATPGVMYMNYMDYTDDGCRNMFSVGQTDYMALVYDVIMPTYYLEDKCSQVVANDVSAFPEPELVYWKETLHISSKHPLRNIVVCDVLGRVIGNWEADGQLEFRAQVKHQGVIILRVHLEGDRRAFVKRLYLSE